LRARVSGQFQDCFSANVWEVVDQYGKPSLIGNMDSGGAGGPAQTCCDGLDAAAMMCQVNNQLPDVESNENLYPMLYLWKRLQPDSGGPGAQRGGLGLDFAWTLWGTAQAHGMLNACTRSVPPRGLFGGLPPTTSRFARVSAHDPAHEFAHGRYLVPDDLASAARLLPAKAFPIELAQGEVFVQWCGGGSGLGDPLLRDPARVVADVNDGYVSPAQAAHAYGVVIDAHGCAAEATAARRAALRGERLGRPASAPVRNVAPVTNAQALAPHLERRAQGEALVVVCACCDEVLAPASADWHDYAKQRQIDLQQHLARLDLWIQARTPALAFIEYTCPACGTLHDSAIVRPPAAQSAA
jgi:N-methylhydantoinase B